MYSADVSVTEAMKKRPQKHKIAEPVTASVTTNQPADALATDHGVFGNMDQWIHIVDAAVFWKHQHIPTLFFSHIS